MSSSVQHSPAGAPRQGQTGVRRNRSQTNGHPLPRLRKSSPVPLYFQLKRTIEQLIDSGEWPPDTQVPSERRLCEQFKISRITVRQALAELERDGRLVRSHGRGTYVAEMTIRKPVYPLVSFTQDVRDHGMQPGARVLQFEPAPPAPHVAAALGLKAGETMILLKRLRFANGKPIAVETVHLPGTRCPDLLSVNLNDRSLYETLRNRYGIVPTRAEQQWQAVSCPRQEAPLLEVEPGAAVLRIEQTTFDAEGRPFEHLESYFRGDKFILMAELRNDVPPGAPAHGSGTVNGNGNGHGTAAPDGSGNTSP